METTSSRPSGLWRLVTGWTRMSIPARRVAIAGYLCILPWLIGFVVLIAVPIAASLQLSFTRWNIVTPAEWVGLDNYISIFRDDPDFWQSLKVTVTYVAVSLPLHLALGLGVALILNLNLWGMSFYRTLFYITTLASSRSARMPEQSRATSTAPTQSPRSSGSWTSRSSTK